MNNVLSLWLLSLMLTANPGAIHYSPSLTTRPVAAIEATLEAFFAVNVGTVLIEFGNAFYQSLADSYFSG